MKLLFIIGDAAAGKMTVGQELMKITDLRLFHNHMTIEPVIEIFGRYEGKTIAEIRDVIFKNYAASDNDGMIFTMMMDLICHQNGRIWSMSKASLNHTGRTSIMLN